jgi:hypothetical protein
VILLFVPEVNCSINASRSRPEARPPNPFSDVLPSPLLEEVLCVVKLDIVLLLHEFKHGHPCPTYSFNPIIFIGKKGKEIISKCMPGRKSGHAIIEK